MRITDQLHAHALVYWKGLLPRISAYYTSIKIIKNEVGYYRDGTVPKTIIVQGRDDSR